MVYLLGRSGNRLEALDVIMTKMDKIDAAIAFCTEHEYDIDCRFFTNFYMHFAKLSLNIILKLYTVMM